MKALRTLPLYRESRSPTVIILLPGNSLFAIPDYRYCISAPCYNRTIKESQPFLIVKVFVIEMADKGDDAASWETYMRF